MEFVKQNVSYKEFMMHDYIYNLSTVLNNGVLNVPKPIHYDVDKKILTMEKIDYMCVSDFYGENEKHISKDLFRTVRSIIRLLYDNHIVYTDITGYNFIEYGGKLWIIDFEHSDFKTHQKDTFVEKFINDETYNRWNPWFK
jgi:tRNA A-37 threonylcarbamoyl transferase component Bud32